MCLPAHPGIDTRDLTMRIRERGTMLGRVEVVEEGGGEGEGEGGGEEVEEGGGEGERTFWDPNKENLTAIVSCKVGCCASHRHGNYMHVYTCSIHQHVGQ